MAAKILIAQFAHETNTFSIRRTELEDFQQYSHAVGDALPAKLSGTNTEIAGFLDAAASNRWAVVPSLATTACPGGVVSEQARRHFTALMVDDLKANPDCDGLILLRHNPETPLVSKSCTRLKFLPNAASV